MSPDRDKLFNKHSMHDPKQCAAHHQGVGPNGLAQI
jgi:hypothetical protein